MLGLAISALARRVLPDRAAAITLVCSLRTDLRYCRDQNSFYRLPEVETFAKWGDQAPRRFLYAVKASRFLTHMKKLKNTEEPIARFFDRVKHLGSHLAPVLYQLPP